MKKLRKHVHPLGSHYLCCCTPFNGDTCPDCRHKFKDIAAALTAQDLVECSPAAVPEDEKPETQEPDGSEQGEKTEDPEPEGEDLEPELVDGTTEEPFDPAVTPIIAPKPRGRKKAANA